MCKIEKNSHHKSIEIITSTCIGSGNNDRKNEDGVDEMLTDHIIYQFLDAIDHLPSHVTYN
jgi:hypothetical protein